MEEERIEKQNYLQREIVDKEFSPDEFMEYCETLKGADIDAYSFKEIKVIVADFQALKSRVSVESDIQPASSSLLEPYIQPRSSSLAEPEISVPESYIERPSLPAKLDQDIKDPRTQKRNDSAAYSISAIKMHDNALSLEELIVVALNPAEPHSGGMLSSTRYLYPVITQPFEWNVKRQVDDFVWLRQTLSTNFPGAYLPPSPPKRFRNSSDANSKQQYFLERFINCIVRNPLLRRSSYLQSFLSENDPKVFTEVKKKSNKDKKIVKIEEFWTLDGTIICDPFSDESEKVALNEYLNVAEAMKKKIKRQSDTVIAALKEVSNLISEVAKSYEILENIQSFVPEITGTKPLYSSLKSSFMFWADHELKTAELIKDYFNMFFKYGYYEVSPLKDLFKERDLKYENYERSKAKLQLKKEKLWTTGDVNKWGLTNEDLWNASVLKNDKMLAISKMLHKETQDIERYKDEFAFYNFQARAEVRRFLLDNQLIENLHFSDFARSMCSHTTSFHVSWGELIAMLSRIRSENIPSRSYIPKTSKIIKV